MRKRHTKLLKINYAEYVLADCMKMTCVATKEKNLFREK